MPPHLSWLVDNQECQKTTNKLVMNPHLSEALAVINNDFDHSQCLNSGVVHKCVNEYVPTKLSDEI